MAALNGSLFDASEWTTSYIDVVKTSNLIVLSIVRDPADHSLFVALSSLIHI